MLQPNGLLVYLRLRASQCRSEAWYQFSIIYDEIRKRRACGEFFRKLNLFTVWVLKCACFMKWYLTVDGRVYLRLSLAVFFQSPTSVGNFTGLCKLKGWEHCYISWGGTKSPKSKPVSHPWLLLLPHPSTPATFRHLASPANSTS